MRGQKLVSGYTAIGAYELKRTYQRNMGLAVLVVVTYWATAVALMGLVTNTSPLTATAEEIERGFDISIETILPPSVEEEPLPLTNTEIAPPPDFSLVEAAADHEVSFDFRLASDLEKSRSIQPGSLTGGKLGNYYAVPAIETIPSPTEFISSDKQPEPINLVSAKYPEMARKAGMEGTVWLLVYIDKRGRVKKVIVDQPSGAEIGFEEAAVEAAWVGEWEPAEQNGKPIGLWVRYPIQFRLR
jgi:protein TonB